MITDPSALIALALCIGVLGLVVLILPLLILFWSQMEPQLIGLVGSESEQDEVYSPQVSLPKLMKSFGNLADTRSTGAGKKGSRTGATPRSKASTRAKTVKAAPTKTAKTKAKTKAAKAEPKPKAKPKADRKKVAAKTGAQGKSGARAVKKAKPKPKVAQRTPAGAKRDPILGLVYSKKPTQIDDLKEIKGVAKVIESKLHKVGIFTFRQIVEWDDAAIDAFSEKLSFKDRIRKDGWQQQCAKFHATKYGEKLG